MKRWELVRLFDGCWSIRFGGVEAALLSPFSYTTEQEDECGDLATAQIFYTNEYELAAQIEAVLNAAQKAVK